MTAVINDGKTPEVRQLKKPWAIFSQMTWCQVKAALSSLIRLITAYIVKFTTRFTKEKNICRKPDTKSGS